MLPNHLEGARHSETLLGGASLILIRPFGPHVAKAGGPLAVEAFLGSFVA